LHADKCDFKANTPYGLVLGVVGAIVIFIVLALFVAQGTRPAVVRFSTLPLTPEVLLDDHVLAGKQSPFVLDQLRPGVQHRLEVRMQGYEPWTTQLVLQSGQVLELPLVTLLPEPPAARAPVATAPPVQPPAPAAPAAETKRVPAAAATEPRSAEAERVGRVKVAPKASAPSKTKPATRRSAVSKAATSPVASGGFGLLRLNSRPWSRVKLDGRPIGNTPQVDLRVPAGSHVIDLENPDLKLHKKLKVQIAANQTVTRIVELQ